MNRIKIKHNDDTFRMCLIDTNDYESVLTAIKKKLLLTSTIKLTYIDCDGDNVSICSWADFAEAMEDAASKLLTILVTEQLLPEATPVVLEHAAVTREGFVMHTSSSDLSFGSSSSSDSSSSSSSSGSSDSDSDSDSDEDQYVLLKANEAMLEDTKTSSCDKKGKKKHKKKHEKKKKKHGKKKKKKKDKDKKFFKKKMKKMKKKIVFLNRQVKKLRAALHEKPHHHHGPPHQHHHVGIGRGRGGRGHDGHRHRRHEEHRWKRGQHQNQNQHQRGGGGDGGGGGGRRIARLVAHENYGPNECILMSGQVIKKKWILRNDSKRDWPNNSQIMLVSKSNDFQASTTNIEATALLKPGQQGEVSMSLIAPQLPGMFESHFRLVDKDTGRKFGQRFPILAEVVAAPSAPWNPNKN